MSEGTVTNHAIALGKGPGVTGLGALTLTDGQLVVGQSGADPQAKTITGDVTITTAGITAIGAGKVTNSMIASMTSAQLRAILSDEVGAGAAYFVGGALGTPASATLTNATGLPLSGLNTQAANTIVANATGSSASPTAVDISTLTAKASPAATDLVLISDQAASGALKKVTVSSLASAGSVASIGGLTGVVGLGTGLTTSGSNIQTDSNIGEVRWLGYNRVPANFLACDGSQVSRTTFAALYAVLVYQSTVTISNASPSVLTWNNHGLSNDDPILLTTTGSLPTGLSTGTKYYVVNASTNTFSLAATPGGTAINTSSAGSGTHTAINAPWDSTTIGNGTTTFTLPKLNGDFIRVIDRAAGVDSHRSFGTEQLDAFQGHKFTDTGHSHTDGADTLAQFTAGSSERVGGSGGGSVTGTASANITGPNSDGVNGTPRTAAETRPRNQTLLAVIRYQ